MIPALALLSAVLAAAAVPPAAASTSAASGVVAQTLTPPEPVGVPGSPSVAVLKERFLGATEDSDRVKFLDEMARTVPVSAQDVSALFDLFSRFPDTYLRRRVMDSLALLQPESPQLEPLFVTYLHQSEPESQLFGINGAFRLRSREALPLVWKIAERKFTAPAAASINSLSERNQWWTQYEALSALAQWQHDKALPLLRKKVKETPAIARLLAQYYWTQTFPELLKWAASSKASDHDRAIEAADAAIEPADARATRDGMLAYIRDPKADPEVRHRFALKVGACSTGDEVAALAAEHDKATDDTMRLIWAAAVFAAHSPKSVPLLVRYARKSPDEPTRAGALAELTNMLGAGPAKALVEDEKDVKK
ncbi:MAG: hypothetical protein KGJ84_02750 [Elusimicrobia bacterium]|nr:hypothetical protein [Elusimicrobiota bacterium]